ncbi:homocysteine S-methyltransferase [Kribbella qitaiheensis]|uniref:Homocysteine S-methyltransferase n=1 Tax=Kribbella qitaiheensis TaxID=1544730 RepID=A0A7G6WUV3_9ACTN|nr:homocysteine S-methyltransferase [Kribbella qitaiheensis]QNE17768.1 homocysteine S-methyltransferase [Kribbella qitaiheensis]
MQILDGGMSNALEDRGHDLSDALWSARLLRDAPGEIAAVHRAYYEAGATFATTASYQASVSGFGEAGVPRDEAERLIASSVAIARQVRDELAGDGVQRFVAASVGPYGAVLADGSEYRGRYGVSKAFLRDFHLPRLELLVAAGPDLLAVETIPDLEEAEALIELIDEIGFPAWVSYSVAGSLTRAEQPLADAFALAGRSTNVVAVGVNCCAPEDVQAAVELAAAVTGKPVVAYPNSGEGWDAGGRRWTGGSSDSAPLASGWSAAGAEYIGGCCRVGTEDIRTLARAITPA